VSFEAPSGGGGAEWGGITGTLSDQTDLQTALDAKFDDPTGTTSQYLRGDGSLATFPSLTGYVPYTGATGDVNLGTHRIIAQNATIASSGSGDTATINHSSGSGVGLNITKGGNGEGLYINKTSGSGNAATIIGTINATTLVKSGGTSSQFLKADGTVDSSVYVPTSREITINGVTFDLSANRSWTVSGGISGSGASGQVAYWTGTSAQSGSNNLFWDNTNGRLGIGTNSPAVKLDVVGNTTNLNTAQFGTIGLQSYAVNNAWFGDNVFFNGTNFVRRANGFASFFYFNQQEGQFRFGSNSTAGSNITEGGGGGLISFKCNLQGSVALGGSINFSPNDYGGAKMLISGTTGNTMLQNGGTFTDSGQRLQVQGTTLLNGNVTFSSATGMTWDAANGRLGIGTNAPTYKLHVVDSSSTAGGQIRGLVVENGSTFNNLTFGIATTTGKGNANAGFLVDGAVKSAFAWDRTRNFLGFNNWDYSSNDFALRINSNGSLTFHNSNTFNNPALVSFLVNNNVLIGSTTDSGQRLQVQGTTLLNGNVTFSSSTGMTWDATNSRLGIGTNAPSSLVDVRTNTNVTNGIFVTNSSTGNAARTIIRLTNDTSNIGQLSIWGSGTGLANKTFFEGSKDFVIGTDCNTASGGTSKFQVYVGGFNAAVSPQFTLHGTANLSLGSTTDSGERLQVTGTMKVTGNLSVVEGSALQWGGARESLVGNGGRGTMTLNQGGNSLGYALTFSIGGLNQASGTGGGLNISPTINPTSGTAVFNLLNVSPTINQTGGANGITRGLYVNPTLTAAADFRAIETARGNVVFGNLPTSPVGLPSGAIWNNLGMINIV
jgi:hypothetical protein